MVLNPLTVVPVQALNQVFLKIVKEGPTFVQHLFQLGQSQEDLSILETEVLVHCKVELIDPSPIVNFMDSFRLDGVDHCLDNGSRGFFGNQGIEELEQLEGLLR